MALDGRYKRASPVGAECVGLPLDRLLSPATLQQPPSTMNVSQVMDLGELPYPIIAILLVVVVGMWYTTQNRRRLPLPPGPTRLPVLGNIFNMPGAVPSGEKYYELTKQYGTSI